MNAMLRSKGRKSQHLQHTAFNLLHCVIEDETGLARKSIEPAPSLPGPVEENGAAPAGPETSAIDDVMTCERIIQTYQETLSLHAAAIRSLAHQ